MASAYRVPRFDDVSLDRIDPALLMVAARRRQAEAIRHGLGLLLDRSRSWLRRISWPGRRRRAIADLQGLDGRLLADIGLRRGDIALMVDGHLDDARLGGRKSSEVPGTGERAATAMAAPAATAAGGAPSDSDARERLAA